MLFLFCFSFFHLFMGYPCFANTSPVFRGKELHPFLSPFVTFRCCLRYVCLTHFICRYKKYKNGVMVLFPMHACFSLSLISYRKTQHRVKNVSRSTHVLPWGYAASHSGHVGTANVLLLCHCCIACPFALLHLLHPCS